MKNVSSILRLIMIVTLCLCLSFLVSCDEIMDIISNNVVDTNQDGTNDDATNDDGTNDDGTNDDGTNDDGTNDDGTNDDGTNDDATNDDGTNDDGTNDDGTNDDGTNDDGTNDDGTNDDGTNDDGTNDDGTNDDGTNDDGTNDDGTNDDNREEDLYPFITIAEALALCGDVDGVTSEERYYIKGTVKELIDTQYGQLTLMDSTGEILVYGTYSIDGALSYPQLEYKPVVGDEIIVYCNLKNYKGTKEIYHAWLVEVTGKYKPDDDIHDTDLTVNTADELIDVISKINSGEISNKCKITLGADIDMRGIPFTPILEFRGLFDGNGYKISNITLPAEGATIYLTDGNWVGYSVQAIGFIASAYDATVKNLALENVNASYDTTTEIFIGALVGYTEGLIVEDCYVSSNFDITVTHPTVKARNISGVSGLVGYSLDAYTEKVTVDCYIDYEANSYEAFLGSMLAVGNIVIENCDITLDIAFIGSRYGHSGYLVGMERTPDGVTLATIYNSRVNGNLYVDNPSGYAWGEIGQGYFYHSDGSRLVIEDYNEINVRIATNR